MTRKPFYDFAHLIGDMFFRRLTLAQRGALMQLMTMADAWAGRLDLPDEDLAALLGLGIADFAACLASFGGFIQGAAGARYFPDMVARADLHEKRRAAGRRGAAVTNAVHGVFTPENNLPRQNVGNVVCLDETRASHEAANYGQRKKKNQKERNNKYIYILKNRVEENDAGSADNPWWITGAVIRMPRRTCQVIADTFGLSLDETKKILIRQDDWLENQTPQTRAHWLAVTIRHFMNLTGMDADSARVAA